MSDKPGRYELLDELGRGGFAIVYRARDTELNRLVALKALRPALLQDTAWVKRFRREARAIAGLDHPQIVTVYDVGQTPDQLFIVMRLVEGSGLDGLLAAQGRLPWSQTLEIMTAVAEALDYAHEHGILHRDLKPANILIDTQRGPLLSDFGLAKLVDEGSMSITTGGGIVGTPHYIAPEVWEGSGTTRQSDIYALGCILYEMLTGEKLFKGESPPAVMMAHFNPLSLPESWPEGVPSVVADVLQKALARQPGDRYASAGQIITALTRVRPSSKTPAFHEPSRTSQARRVGLETPALIAKSAAEMLSIRTFGGLTIGLGHMIRPLHFETRTVEALLVYLACQGRPLGRDVLAELLWPERTQEQARTNLRVAIHRLRQQLEPYLRVTRQDLALALDAPIYLDSRELEAYLAAGRLAEATALYQGDFLEGFYLDGSPAFEQWALLERERLRNLVIAAYQQLITQATAAGQPDAAIAHAERLLQLDPLHEPTHRQLMRLLAQAGRRAAALAQYTLFCQIAEAELGVPPDETTTALYEQIRAGTLDQEIRRKEEILRPLSAPPQYNLPPQPTPFIGRETELAQIGNLLANLDCRLLTLLGVGGLGKTRLAIETATRQAGNFADGVCFVALAPVGTADLVPVAIAQSLALQTTSSDLQAQIAAYLGPRELLLVLDNFEHVLEAAETVAHLLHSAPKVKALVTSRERLYLLEEWLLPIAGLPVTEGAAGEAGQLFLRSAQRVRPDFVARGQEQAIAAICRQVEGMPLALELAASWVRVMPCEEIARQLVHNPTILTTSLRNLPERHRSLRNLFDYSWRLLTLNEQSVLQRVSVFQGGWTLAEAEAVAGATLPLLLSLVDKSLVRLGDQNRFELHELIRQYGAEQLTASREGDVIRQRHYTTYLQLARTVDSTARGPEAATWFARLEPEQDNLRAAWQWTLDTQRFVDAAWLGVALGYIWTVRGQWYEGTRWLEQLLPHRHELSVELRLAILLTLYRFWRAFHEFQKIDQYADELMQLHEACTDKLLQAAVWFFIGNTTPDATQAVAAYNTCLGLLHEAAESPGPGDEFCFFADRDNLLAMTLMRYGGRLIDEQGEYAQAALLATESLKLFQARGNRVFIVFALGHLGRLAWLRGDLAQAHSLLHETVTIAASVGSRLGLGDWQPRLGIITLYYGNAAEAHRLLIESLNLCIHLKSDELLARIYGYLAEVALWEGALDQAAQWLAQSVVYQANIHWLTIEFADFLWVAARLATAQQHYRRAATLFGLAEQISSQVHYPLNEPMRPLVDAALATVREALDPATFADAFATGQQLPLNEAFTTILAPGYKV